MTPNVSSCCAAPTSLRGYRLGKKLFCQIRGWVTVRRVSAGPIHWPQTIVGGNRTYILCGDLVKAVRRESEIAIAHSWGVGQFTVWKWRKALDVSATNEGTARLRQDHFNEPWAHKARKKAHAKARDPVRRAKIAAAKRGKPRPRHVIEAMAAGRRGKPHSAEARRKMSEAHQRRGTRPPKAGPAWKPAEDALLAGCRMKRLRFASVAPWAPCNIAGGNCALRS